MAFALLAVLFLDVCAALAWLGPLGRFPAAAMVLYAAGFGLMLALERTFPRRLNGRRGLLLVLALGLAARLLFLAHPPSDDVNRYVLEGLLQHAGLNPYSHAPDSPEALAVARQAGILHVWERVNHKDFAAAYPPLALLVFRLLAGLSHDPWVFRAALSAVEFLGLALTALAVDRLKLPPARLLYCAANPLLLVFLSGEGHLDALQLAAVAGCAAALAGGRRGLAFLALGLATGFKYFAVVGLPFLVTARTWTKAVWFLPPLAAFLPFLGADVLGSLGAFGQLHYNDMLASLLRPLLGDATVPAMALLLAGLLALALLAEHRPVHGLFLAFGALLLCLPTLHPWYLALLAPLLPLARAGPWLWLMAAMAFTFPVMGHDYATGVFQEGYLAKPLMLLPFVWLWLRGLGRGLGRFGPVARVSVVVPTLDEAGNIGPCLAALSGDPCLAEIIVADGGSRDATPQLAAALGARVVRCPPGRGRQIAAGAALAMGDAVLVVHADGLAPPLAASRVAQALNGRPDAAGGSFGMTFGACGWLPGLLAALNNGRARLAGISFGDQGQFFRRGVVQVPELPLMEDVELALRIKEAGGWLCLPQAMRASPRRWLGPGRAGNVLRVVRLLGGYLLRRRLGLGFDAANAYAGYYGRPRQG